MNALDVADADSAVWKTTDEDVPWLLDGMIIPAVRELKVVRCVFFG